jgi:hypothetical protein
MLTSLEELVEIILLQQYKVDVVRRSWSRSFYFRNPKLTSFEEAGRDNFTSATQVAEVK